MKRALFGVVIVILLLIGAYVLWQGVQPIQQEEVAEIKRLRLEIDGLRQEHGLLLEQREELIGQLNVVRHQKQQLQGQLK